MDNNLTDNVQSCIKDVDTITGRNQAMEDSLRNPVIVRRILEHVSSKELLQISLVNKLWKYEAQNLMRNRGQFIAYVKSHGFGGNHPQKQVEAFISDLKLLNPIPFSGISMDVWMILPFPAPVPIPAPDLVDLEGVVLDTPTLKTVSVKFHGTLIKHIASPAVLLTRKVLQDCSGFLEELELDIDDGIEYFVVTYVQYLDFPRLQILTLSGVDFRLDDASCENYMKVILSRAPNLKVLRGSRSINVLLSVLEGSSVIPVYEYIKAPFEEISENVLSKIKLEKMSLELQYFGHEFSFQRFNRITPMLLQQSCTTTLRCIWLDAVLAVPLMTYGIRLENVKDLYMDIAYDHLERMEPRILRIVKNFDFSRIFPKLNKVNIHADHSVQGLSPDHLNAMIERANAVVREPLLDRAARIKGLVLRWNHSDVAAHFFNEMFPNTEKLEIIKRPGDYGQVPFGSIWNWLELKELKVRGGVLPTTGNLDSIFCGIFPEEVAELRLKDEEYLSTVNIVPIMPAITCVKNLRTLSLVHEHHRRDSFRDDSNFIFSNVTVLLAFARLPALAVSLKIRASEAPAAMGHLEPYVSVTSELRDYEHWYSPSIGWTRKLTD